MGNEKTITKKNQAEQAMSSGAVKGHAGIPAGVSNILTIKLVKLSKASVKDAKEKDGVIVKWHADDFYCFNKDVMLGKIPANFRDYFNPGSSYQGTIVHLKMEPMEVAIKVKLH
ncbi:MAG: hypothetical protein EOO07_10075 [Chitinophagaceae bacterium]|nr:MAG: hypothetical protein EOO07_10075 [Chitinophagaceae bacterium]